MAHQQVSKGN